MKDESQQQVPPYEWNHFSGLPSIIEFANKNRATIISISNDDSGNWWAVYTKLPPPSSLDRSVSQPGKEFEIPQTSTWDGSGKHFIGVEELQSQSPQWDKYDEIPPTWSGTGPPQPSQPGEGDMTPKVAKQFFDAIDRMPLPEQGKEEAFGGKEVTILDLVEEKRKLQWRIVDLKEELAALKSRPSEGWSDELRNDFAIEFMLWNTPVSVPNRQGKRNEIYTLMQDFIESPSGRQWLSSYKQKG